MTSLPFQKINSGTLVIFTEQLAAMVSAQLPLLQIIETLASEIMDKKLKSILNKVIARLELGHDLGDILEDYPEAFSSIYVNMVRAGMNSGRLDVSLEQLAKYLKQTHETIGKVSSAVTYPLFLVFALIIVMAVIIYWILPNFRSLYDTFGGELPKPTQWLIAFAYAVEQWWHLGVLTVSIILFLYWLYIQTPDGRWLSDRIRLRFPIFGSFFYRLAIARFLRTMAVLVQSEVPIIKTLNLAAPASGNVYIEGIIIEASSLVERGRSLTYAFRESGLFHGIVLQMISSGEESGVLDRLLFSASNFYDKLTEYRIQSIIGLINPILTILIGMIISLLLIALFLPIFEMGSVARGV